MPSLYLDSCVFIAALESMDDSSRSLLQLFKRLQRNPEAAITSELTLAELLAPVKRMPQAMAEKRMPLYLDFFDRGAFVGLIPITRSILMETATVRADYPQRLPDAIHISTALALGCSFYMTFDKDARRLPAPLRWVTTDPDDLAAIGTLLDA